MNSGTSGASEPAWPVVFGNTIVDGSITWQTEDRNWTASRTYPVGAVVGSAAFFRFGFNFLVTTAGTTGLTEPQWPTTIGASVNDGSVVWKVIGFYPGSFRGCDPMQLVLRDAGGVETVLAKEGDPIGGAGSELSGWAEFYALNNPGIVALRTSVMGRLTDEDESGSGIFLVGPGPVLTEVAASNTTIDGRGVCGFGAMVAINDGGQVLFDGYLSALQPWQANHAFGANTQIIPTSGIGVPFTTAGGGTTGGSEPAWPQTLGTTVVDGAVTWVSQRPNNYCSEDRHGMYRYSSGSGNQLLIAVGTDVGGGTTVVGFGNDVVPAVGNCAFHTCLYEDLDGFLNLAGHASVVARLSTGDTAAYLLTGPLTFTEVARTGGAGPGGVFGRVYPRTELNASDKVLFKAQVGGVDELLRWANPSTYSVVAAVGDDVGTRSGGAASGTTLTALGFYGDINTPGNVVFQATLSTGPNAYFFWDGTTGLLTEIASEGSLPANFASEMVTLNDSNLVAFTSGAGPPEFPEQLAERDEKGLHFWTKTGGKQNVIQNGDIINGLTVSSVMAQHPSFRQRQLNSAGCVSVQYFVNGLVGNPTEDASEGSGVKDMGVPPAGQLLTVCSQAMNASSIPTLSGYMLALFGVALAAAALVLLLAKR